MTKTLRPVLREPDPELELAEEEPDEAGVLADELPELAALVELDELQAARSIVAVPSTTGAQSARLLVSRIT